MTQIELLKNNGMLIAMRESLGIEGTDASKDDVIESYDDVTIARMYVAWKAEKESLDFEFV